MPLSGHSQDQELLVHTNWGPSQESPPHIIKTAWNANEPSPREIIDNQDSGYNTRSQASYGPESQETYTTDLSDGHVNTPPSTVPPPPQHSSSHTDTTTISCLRGGGKVKGQRGSKEDLKNTSPGGSKSSLFKSGDGRY